MRCSLQHAGRGNDASFAVASAEGRRLFRHGLQVEIAYSLMGKAISWCQDSETDRVATLLVCRSLRPSLLAVAFSHSPPFWELQDPVASQRLSQDPKSQRLMKGVRGDSLDNEGEF
jgi:hypothetical protein